MDIYRQVKDILKSSGLSVGCEDVERASVGRERAWNIQKTNFLFGDDKAFEEYNETRLLQKEKCIQKAVDTSKNHLEDYWANGHHQRHWVSNETGERKENAYHSHKFKEKEEKYIHYKAKKLKDDLKKYFNTFFVNESNNFKVRFSKNSASKMGSDKSVTKSIVNGFTINEHFEAAENIKPIFENSYYIGTFSEDKNKDNVIDIKRFEKKINLSTGKKAYAYITIKNTLQGGNMLYSVELILKKYPSSIDGGEHQRLNKSVSVALDCNPLNVHTIPRKSPVVNKSILFEFTDLTPNNRKDKIEKAVRILSKQLGVPVAVERLHEHKGEAFAFKAQEELTYKWADYLNNATKEVYGFVCAYFDLPVQNILQKADVLRHKGQILYSPETGKPIKKSDWDNFVKALEKILNRKYGETGKKIVLDSQSLGRLLDRMLKYNKLPEVKDVKLSDIRYSGKSFSYIAESARNAEKVFGAIDNARLELLEQSAAERITGVTEQMKHDIKQVLIDGVKSRKSKQQISQELFNKLTGTNRDFRKIADTEIQNNINNAFLEQEVEATPKGEKVYFKRMEIVDGATCPFCKKMNDTIAVWSDTPLSNDKVDGDPYATVALWQGKDWNGQKDYVANGVFHPYCRGIWIRWNSLINAFSAMAHKRNVQYNAAVDKAREEWKAKGVDNPNDKTPGYIERINELYNSGDVQKSLTWSGYELQDRYNFAGLKISIENKKGTTRTGKDEDGHEWHTFMHYDYGYIRGTEGVDGDHVDCYIGDNENAKNVYIIHQNNPVTHEYDEDKCMLGFNTLEEAKKAYIKQYDRPGFLGSITTMGIEEFKDYVLAKENHAQRISP